jgi:DNA polymerase
MNDKDQLRADWLALLNDVSEYAAYMRELGIEYMEPAASVRAAAGPAPGAAREAAGRADATTLNALERNAAAAAQAPGGGTHKQPSPDQAEAMTKRRTRETTRTGAPVPQESLFGEITPRDEASLPRPGETLEDIWADIGDCTRCPLHEGRTQVVNSEGNRSARLMFVGEAPGADEDAQGRPFVGRAGQLLNKIIEAIGMKREQVFIGNVNRCRPPQNRTPTPSEAATCKPFLLREIAIVKPDVIVVLGNTAMKNLLDTKEGITKLRGQFQDYRGIKVMPTFHPAYLLRDPSKKREAWEDMKKVRDYLDGKLKLD